ncbi:hypothetical protein cyc_07915 [Cyclospora cayetanensis]|uniref:Uncharacterized protein n=1 Tax=Cyclospora cayetanensis TaxID=88456 RepID=A0A1D3CU48_9EIME|nr:hypothetical protein cyc_07915 [Cyclospora cayetanensis]
MCGASGVEYTHQHAQAGGGVREYQAKRKGSRTDYYSLPRGVTAAPVAVAASAPALAVSSKEDVAERALSASTAASAIAATATAATAAGGRLEDAAAAPTASGGVSGEDVASALATVRKGMAHVRDSAAVLLWMPSEALSANALLHAEHLPVQPGGLLPHWQLLQLLPSQQQELHLDSLVTSAALPPFAAFLQQEASSTTAAQDGCAASCELPMQQQLQRRVHVEGVKWRAQLAATMLAAASQDSSSAALLPATGAAKQAAVGIAGCTSSDGSSSLVGMCVFEMYPNPLVLCCSGGVMIFLKVSICMQQQQTKPLFRRHQAQTTQRIVMLCRESKDGSDAASSECFLYAIPSDCWKRRLEHPPLLPSAECLAECSRGGCTPTGCKVDHAAAPGRLSAWRRKKGWEATLTVPVFVSPVRRVWIRPSSTA